MLLVILKTRYARIRRDFSVNDQNDSPDQVICVLQYSPGRSGSTMVFQVLEYLGTQVRKTHEYLHVEPDTKVVITYRHPYDMFCSYFRISRELDGDEDLQAVMRQALNPAVWWTMFRGLRYVRIGYKRLQKYMNSDMEMCILRYEIFKDDNEYLFDRLESFLGIRIDSCTRDRVGSATSVTSNRLVAAHYAGFKEFDPETRIHGRHLGSGAAGQWRYVCPPWMQRILTHALGGELSLYWSVAERCDGRVRCNCVQSDTPIR